MRYCGRCGLPETYENIVIEESGTCNFCKFYEEHKRTLRDYEKLERQFDREVEAARRQAKENGAKYDCIVGLSGGKDGAYITYQMMHKYGLRVLTFTLDNGFSTDFGRKNIEILLEKLKVDHVWVKPEEEQLRKMYTGSMRLMKNFCSVCFHYCHYYAYLLAGRYRAPLIVNGRTRGQILQKADAEKGIEPFEISHTLKQYEYQMFGRLVEKLDGYSCLDFLPETNATALSYFMYHDVGEEEKMQFLAEKTGWIKPEAAVVHPDCWAHPMAEQCSLKKHGYPVRTGELAVLIREGKMTLQEAARELEKDRENYRQADPGLRKRFEDQIRCQETRQTSGKGYSKAAKDTAPRHQQGRGFGGGDSI